MGGWVGGLVFLHCLDTWVDCLPCCLDAFPGTGDLDGELLFGYGVVVRAKLHKKFGFVDGEVRIKGEPRV